MGILRVGPPGRWVPIHLHPDLVADAERVLSEAGLPCDRVIDVDSNVILYVNRQEAARTAWLSRERGTGRLKVRMQEGFPAEAPEGWHAQVD